MPEKTPKFERPPVKVFGKIQEEKKKEWSEEISKRFREGFITELSEKVIKKIEALEYDKRPYEVDFINESNTVTNEILKKYGLKEFDFPVRNVHILPPQLFKELSSVQGGTAISNFRKQSIFLNGLVYRPNPLSMAQSMFHEIIHQKGFLSFDIEEKKPEQKEEVEKDYKISERRTGLMTYGSYKKSHKGQYYESFRGLNEAVVAEIEKEYLDKVVKSSTIPEIKKELEWLDSEEAKTIKQKLAEENKIPVEEIVSVSRDGKNFVGRGYVEQRKVLHYLIGEIAVEQGISKEEALDLFIKAHFTGNILKIAKLVEKTFGPNSFFVLGNMDGETPSARRTLDYLKKQRLFLKKKSEKLGLATAN